MRGSFYCRPKITKIIGEPYEEGTDNHHLIGTSFLAGLSKDVFKDAVKNEVEKWLKDNGPKIVRKADVVVAKRLPHSVADSFHKAVKNYIDSSPEKTELKPPPK